MGQYRHVTDLAAFARGLSFLGELALLPADSPARTRRGAASRFSDLPALGELDLVEPARPGSDSGWKTTADGKPVIEWRILLQAARHFATSGQPLTELEGRAGEFVVIGLGAGLDSFAFDDEFEAARARGDVVIDSDHLYIRPAPAPN